ncbi:hypothetical protein SKAU_G00216530 [Synaphobranchus kaupii]|uniref:Uncharacterized protein n=1 Tax=Synaphobranchus kaupii TaxID=118154 RepID=A0A9Q1F9Y3_SYNKA|nr:hypothetical protein SKAU_G00216530 [Synaphobranchus kaupii]
MAHSGRAARSLSATAAERSRHRPEMKPRRCTNQTPSQEPKLGSPASQTLSWDMKLCRLQVTESNAELGTEEEQLLPSNLGASYGCFWAAFVPRRLVCILQGSSHVEPDPRGRRDSHPGTSFFLPLTPPLLSRASMNVT